MCTVSTNYAKCLQIMHSVYILHLGKRVSAQCLHTTHTVYKLCTASTDYTFSRTRIRVYIAYAYMCMRAYTYISGAVGAVMQCWVGKPTRPSRKRTAVGRQCDGCHLTDSGWQSTAGALTANCQAQTILMWHGVEDRAIHYHCAPTDAWRTPPTGFTLEVPCDPFASANRRTSARGRSPLRSTRR